MNQMQKFIKRKLLLMTMGINIKLDGVSINAPQKIILDHINLEIKKAR